MRRPPIPQLEGEERDKEKYLARSTSSKFNEIPSTFYKTNLLLVENEATTGGSGGNGGTSNNTDRGLGSTGEAGVYGTYLYQD